MIISISGAVAISSTTQTATNSALGTVWFPGTLSFKPAKKAFEKARQMARANQNTMGESRALVNLAGTAWHLGQRHAAFLLLDKGEALAKAAGDQIGCCRILLNRGLFFEAKNNLIDARKYIQQALIFAEALDWAEGIVKARRALKKSN